MLRSLAALVLPLEYPPARDVAARLGLGELFGQRVAELSGGEAQRVALARLLVQDPEPVASVDPALADELLALLCELARVHGRTVVASLHAPELARRHFDRVVGLRRGEVAFDLPAGQVSGDILGELYGRPVAAGDGAEGSDDPADPTQEAHDWRGAC